MFRGISFVLSSKLCSVPVLMPVCAAAADALAGGASASAAAAAAAAAAAGWFSVQFSSRLYHEWVFLGKRRGLPLPQVCLKDKDILY